MARKTNDEIMIDALCESYGLRSKAVYDLTKIILEGYKKGYGKTVIPLNIFSEQEIIREKQEMRREFLRLMSKDPRFARKEQQAFILRALRAPWMMEKIHMLLNEVGNYEQIGGLYKSIIIRGYGPEFAMTNEEVAKAEHVSDAVIDYRKREAIKLFGIKIWEYCYRRENEDIAAGLVDNAI